LVELFINNVCIFLSVDENDGLSLFFERIIDVLQKINLTMRLAFEVELLNII